MGAEFLHGFDVAGLTSVANGQPAAARWTGLQVVRRIGQHFGFLLRLIGGEIFRFRKIIREVVEGIYLPLRIAHELPRPLTYGEQFDVVGRWFRARRSNRRECPDEVVMGIARALPGKEGQQVHAIASGRIGVGSGEMKEGRGHIRERTHGLRGSAGRYRPRRETMLRIVNMRVNGPQYIREFEG